MKKYCGLIALLCLLWSVLYCQTASEKADLVKALSVAQTDSAKIKLLVQLCNITQDEKHYPEAINYALQVLKLRKQVGSKRDLANTFNFIGNLYSQVNDLTNAGNYWLSADKMLDEIKDSSFMHADVLENLGKAYFLQADYLHARHTLEKAVTLSLARQDQLHEAAARLFLGRSYDKLLHFQLAKENFEKALQIYTEKNRRGDIAVLLNQLGNLMAGHGEFTTGLAYGYQSLRIGEQINDPSLIVANLNDISNMLLKNREYDTALNYLSEAKKRLGNNKLFSAYIFANIGSICIAKDDNVKAITYLTEAKQLSEALQLKEVSASVLNNLSALYSKSEQYKPAMEALLGAFNCSREINDNGLLATAFTNAGKIYQQMAGSKTRKNWPDSLVKLTSPDLLHRSVAYLKKSLELSKKMNKLDLLQEDYRLLANGLHQLDSNNAAFENFSSYILYRDSVFNLEKASAQNKMMLQYAFDKKAAEKDKANAIAQASAKARIKLYVSIAVALMLLSFMGFYFVRRNENNKHQLELLSLKQAALNAQISDHFISNVMDSINRFIKSNDREKASQYLERFSRLVREVLANASSKMITIEEDLKILRDYIELEKLRYVNGSLEYDIRVDETIDIAQTLIPPMVLQLLVENSLKHGFTKTTSGKLNISINRNGRLVDCMVKDNGSGRTVKNQPGENEQRKSFGSSLAERLVKTSGIKSTDTSFNIIDLTDDDNNVTGTAVKFTYPYITID